MAKKEVSGKKSGKKKQHAEYVAELYRKLAKIKKNYPQFSVLPFYWPDLETIMNAEKITFMRRNLPRKVAAMYYYGINAYIAIDGSLDNVHEIEYAICHEIAHHWLHRDHGFGDIKIREHLDLEKEREIEAEIVAFTMYDPDATLAMGFWELLIEKEAGRKFVDEALDILLTLKKSIIELRRVRSKVLVAPTSRRALQTNLDIVTKRATLPAQILQFKMYLEELVGQEKGKSS